MQNVYKNIEEYNPGKKHKVLIVFDDMIADIFSNKKRYPTVTDLFVTGRKLKISLVFITPSYFKVPKDVRLNFIHSFIFKIPKNSFLERIYKKIMATDQEIIDEKQRYNINKETAKVSAFSLCKIDKYEYFTR